jgi:hypothetical protein
VTSLRLWILILALVCFAVGLASGLWVSSQSFRPVPERGPFADYRELLVETFDLSPRRAAALADVLAAYEKEIEEIKDRHMAGYMSAMEPELREKGRYYRDLIQHRVLPENQRAEFESDLYVQNWPSKP